jgi:dihydrofolate reductase
MLVSMIAAVAQNGTIGRNNQLPWHIAEDMRFFTNTTRGHVVITGRKNFDAMGAALPQRTNIVVTRNPVFNAPDTRVVASVEAALQLARALGETEAFVIGGAELFHAAKPYAHHFYRTTVLADVAGDVRYIDDDWTDWSEERLATGLQNEENEHAFVITKLTRRGAPRPFQA